MVGCWIWIRYFWYPPNKNNIIFDWVHHDVVAVEAAVTRLPNSRRWHHWTINNILIIIISIAASSTDLHTTTIMGGEEYVEGRTKTKQ